MIQQAIEAELAELLSTFQISRRAHRARSSTQLIFAGAGSIDGSGTDSSPGVEGWRPYGIWD